MSDEQQAAKRAAEKICETWSVGTASRFCDDAPDWDAAEHDDVAKVIAAEYADVIAERDLLRLRIDNCTMPVPNMQEMLDLAAERDRLAAQVGCLRELLKPYRIRDWWWRFDNHQQPLSSWHDREEFIERITEALTEQPNA